MPVKITDVRKQNPITKKPINPRRDLKSMKADPDLLKDIYFSAKDYGIDPNLAFAVGLQESNLGKTDSRNPFRVNNLYHGPVEDPIDFGMSLLRDKYNKNPKESEAIRIQRYNGLTKKTKAKPDYGNQVISLRDSVIKQSPELQALYPKFDSLYAHRYDYMKQKPKQPAKQPVKTSWTDRIKTYGSVFNPLGWFGDGGQIQPYITSDPKDPRIQAYKDSSDLYHYYQAQQTLEPFSIKDKFIHSDSRNKRQAALMKIADNFVKNNPNLTFGSPYGFDPSLGTRNARENYLKNGSPDLVTKDGSIQPTGMWLGEATNNSYQDVAPKQKVVYSQINPYYTSDPNDPRIQAYRDSLDAYNKYGNISKDFTNRKYANSTDVNYLNNLVKEANNNKLAQTKDYHMNMVSKNGQAPIIKVPFFTYPKQRVIYQPKINSTSNTSSMFSEALKNSETVFRPNVTKLNPININHINTPDSDLQLQQHLSTKLPEFHSYPGEGYGNPNIARGYYNIGHGKRIEVHADGGQINTPSNPSGMHTGPTTQRNGLEFGFGGLAPLLGLAGNLIAPGVGGMIGSTIGQLAEHVKFEDGGQTNLVPINIEGHNVKNISKANAQKGELLTSGGKILKNYISRPPHPELGMNPLGNDQVPEGSIVIPKNRTQEYMQADRTKRRQIERSLISQQERRESKKDKQINKMLNKMVDGGYISPGIFAQGGQIYDGETLGYPTGGEVNNPNNLMGKGGWIQKAINPSHKGWCTPLSNPKCTGHRRALALRFKHGDLKHGDGGIINPNISTGRGIVNRFDWGGGVNNLEDSTIKTATNALNSYDPTAGIPSWILNPSEMWNTNFNHINVTPMSSRQVNSISNPYSQGSQLQTNMSTPKNSRFDNPADFANAYMSGKAYNAQSNGIQNNSSPNIPSWISNPSEMWNTTFIPPMNSPKPINSPDNPYLQSYQVEANKLNTPQTSQAQQAKTPMSDFDKYNKYQLFSQALPAISDIMDMTAKVTTPQFTPLNHVKANLINPNTGQDQIRDSFNSGYNSLRDSGVYNARSHRNLIASRMKASSEQALNIANQNVGIQNQFTGMNTDIDKYNLDRQAQLQLLREQGEAKRREARRNLLTRIPNALDTYMQNNIYKKVLGI